MKSKKTNWKPNTYVWISGEAIVDSVSFNKCFTEYKDTWNELIRYFKFHPDEGVSKPIADKVRKNMNYTHFSAFDFRRLYYLAWEDFHNGTPYMECNPNKYKRIVGIYTKRLDTIDICYGHVSIHGSWEMPDELLDDDILPTDYRALEEIVDEKGNVSYIYHIRCLKLPYGDIEGKIECLYRMAKTDSKIHQTRELLAYVPKKNKVL